MAYFNPSKPTELTVVGFGAVLAQKATNSDGETEVHIVVYASQALTDMEQRYSRTGKDALVIVLGCEKFSLYLNENAFDLKTDHKSL